MNDEDEDWAEDRFNGCSGWTECVYCYPPDALREELVVVLRERLTALMRRGLR